MLFFKKQNATWKVISKLDCFLDIHILTDKKHHGKVIFHKQHWWLWYPLSQKLSVDRKHKKNLGKRFDVIFTNTKEFVICCLWRQKIPRPQKIIKISFCLLWTIEFEVSFRVESMRIVHIRWSLTLKYQRSLI